MKQHILLSFVFLCFGWAHAQNAFQEEVDNLVSHTDSIWDASKETIVFTGSSSVRMWEDLQERFPDKQILNMGFGGSQSSDLERYLDELILKYNPVKVFIYEGDNDIQLKKRPRAIAGTMLNILEELRHQKPELDIVLISAKPSISRWHLKRKYIRLNKRLRKLAAEMKDVQYADVWTIMLNKRKLKKDLFIEDGLHMNSKGYDLWYNVLKDFVNSTTP